MQVWTGIKSPMRPLTQGPDPQRALKEQQRTGRAIGGLTSIRMLMRPSEMEDPLVQQKGLQLESVTTCG